MLILSACNSAEKTKNKDDKAIAKVKVVPAGNEDSVKQAKDECPVEAIIVE